MGISRSANVSMEIGVGVEMLEVGVSSIGVRRGAAVVWRVGMLQDDIPKIAVMTTTHKRSCPVDTRFLIYSSFSLRIVIAGLIYGNRLLYPVQPQLGQQFAEKNQRAIIF